MAGDGVFVTAKYVPNPAGIAAAAELGGTIGVREWLELAESEAKSIAPVETGAYRDSIHTQQSGARGQLIADIRYAVFLEFGTSDTPIFATLRTAADTTKLP